MKAMPATAVMFLILAASPLEAEDFRVETDVFRGDESQPFAETLTLFYGDVVYDMLLTEPREITVFDVRRGRLVLLDPDRKVRATMNKSELLEFTAAIKTRAGQGDEPPLFGYEFATSFDPDTDELILRGTNLTYRVRGEEHAASDEVKRFHSFADWYARLNAVRPGNPPPFARLRLNRELAERQLLPQEIRRTLTIPGRFRDEQHEMWSRHTFTWSLSTTDRKRIEDAGTQMATFKSVGLANYWQMKRVAAKPDEQ